MGDVSSPLRSRGFRNLFAARVISVFGDSLVPVALVLGVLQQTGSASSVGLVIAARSVATVVFVLAGGVWADRVSRRGLMIGADVVRCGVQLGTAAVLLGSGPIAALAALQFAHGGATAVANPAATALVRDVAPAGTLQRANGLLATVANAGGIAGPAVAGVLVAFAGAGYALALDALTFLASAACLARIPAATGAAPSARAPFGRELREGWGELTRRTWLWVSVVDASVFQLLASSAFVVVAPVIVLADLGGTGAWALVAALFAAGSVAGGLATLGPAVERPLLVGYTLSLSYAGLLVAVGLRLPLAVVGALAFAAGAGLAYAETLYETAVQEHVPDRVLARVSAWDWLGSSALAPIGFAAIGPVSEALGAETALLIAAGGSAAMTCAALAVPDVRGLRRARTGDGTA